jgi:hypothetical protein
MSRGRNAESMAALGNTAGFAMVVVTLINQSALRDGHWLAPYSTLINLVDLLAILSLCFWSIRSRNFIIGLFNRAKTET